MKKLLAGLTLIAVIMVSGMAFATPSTQIWIPSTDVQAYKKAHFGTDSYIATEGNGVLTNIGLTVGVLPYQMIQAEVGVDYKDINGLHVEPLYFNVKVGTPEGSLFKESPAIAVGGYDFGMKTTTDNTVGTDYNVMYGLVAKTFGKAGRISAGYYSGNDKLLLDKNSEKDNSGLLLSWDRTLSELSENLWVAVDYQGANNSYGALSLGFSWKFAPNASVIAGYDIFNESALYKPTATVQVDMDF